MKRESDVKENNNQIDDDLREIKRNSRKRHDKKRLFLKNLLKYKAKTIFGLLVFILAASIHTILQYFLLLKLRKNLILNLKDWLY